MQSCHVPGSAKVSSHRNDGVGRPPKGASRTIKSIILLCTLSMCSLGNTLPLGVLPWLSGCLWKCGWNIIFLPSLSLIMFYLLSCLLSVCALSFFLSHLCVCWTDGLSWPLIDKMAPTLEWRIIRIFQDTLDSGQSDSRVPCFILVDEQSGYRSVNTWVSSCDKHIIYQTLLLHFSEAQGAMPT